MRQEGPNFFCDEWHERVQHFQHVFENHDEDEPYDFLVFFIVTPESLLDQFDIPIAVFIPDQLINLLASQGEVIFFQCICNIFYRIVNSADDPLVLVTQGDIAEVGRISASHAAAVTAAFC